MVWIHSIYDNVFDATWQGISNKFNVLDVFFSFTIKSLLDKMPAQKFTTDEFLTNSISSKYYSLSEFIDVKFSKKAFSMIHLKIASLQLHIDELRYLLVLLQPNTHMMSYALQIHAYMM